MLQQIGVIQWKNMTTSNVFAYLKKKIKAISKVVKDKTISQKFIHHIEGLLMKEMVNASKHKLMSLYPKQDLFLDLNHR